MGILCTKMLCEEGRSVIKSDILFIVKKVQRKSYLSRGLWINLRIMKPNENIVSRKVMSDFMMARPGQADLCRGKQTSFVSVEMPRGIEYRVLLCLL